jgi:GNAT superfamily N-acetyltransferase
MALSSAATAAAQSPESVIPRENARMGSDYTLREARVDDFDALVALATASADTGRIRVAPRYLRNPVEIWAALKPELQWVVAEAGESLIGGGMVVLGETEVEGERYPSATLGGLMVEPAHRRRGVARALTEWRLERAGSDAVIAAAIQTGNEGSLANARRWATQIFGTLTVPVFRAGGDRSTPRGLEIREPRDDEWDAAASGLAEFEHGWNLRNPETGASLRERSERTVSGDRLQRYNIAVDAGAVVGGFELFEQGRIQSVVVEHMPVSMRLVTRLLRMMPPDGEIRQASISRIWFAAGRDDVARALWTHARAIAAEGGNAIGTQYDARSPLRKLVPLKPWTPKGQVSVAVRSPVHLSEDRILSPP